MGFTENFNYCMEQRNYSAYRFAKILGVNIQSPVNWKTGASIPHYGTRQKIADHFGITLAELDGDELPILPPEGAKKAPAAKGQLKVRKRSLICELFTCTIPQKRCIIKSATPEYSRRAFSLFIRPVSPYRAQIKKPHLFRCGFFLRLQTFDTLFCGTALPFPEKHSAVTPFHNSFSASRHIQ